MEPPSTSPVQGDSLLGTPPYWTSRRQEICNWLRGGRASLADLYESAVHLTYGSYLPSRLHLVGHAVREIRNGLPSALSPEVRRGRFDYQTELSRLAESWARSGFGLDGALPAPPLTEGATTPPLTEGATTPPADIPVPRSLLIEIATLLAGHRRAGINRRHAAYCLFDACLKGEAATPERLAQTADQWLEVTEWFMERTHDSGVRDSSHEAQLAAQFEVFESYLSALAGDFFATLEEIDAILADANA